MLEAISLIGLLRNPKTSFGSYAWTHTHWRRDDSVALGLLCYEAVNIEKAAECLGRTPTSIAWRARDTGLELPAHWRSILSRRQASSEPTQLLSYPYITSVRGEHQTLLAVNRLVPRSLPDHIRGDVCQEIMLAIWEGTITLDDLHERPGIVREFMNAARKANYEGGGYALSLDAPMRDGRSWYEVLAAPEDELA